MRKVTICIMLFATFSVANSTTSVNTKPPLKASEIYLPVGKSGELLSLQELSVIKIKDFEALTGKKMKLMDRIGFKASQNQLRNSIDRDGTFNKKQLQKYLNKKKADGTTGFHSGGFFLGLLVGLIGVIIAYFIKDEKKKNRVKWAWIGWGIWVVIAIILVATTSYTVY